MTEPSYQLDYRLDYGPLTPWAERLAVEGPFLERLLAAGPTSRVLDLGCGTGEHARWLAERGFDVVAVDASKEMLEAAGREPMPPRLKLEGGDMGAVEALVRGQFGGAICLGNSLAHIVGTESLGRMMIGLRRRLLPGAPFVIHTFNYDRIFDLKLRHLPPETRRDEEGDLVSLPLLEAQEDGILLFSSYRLRHRPGEERPLEVLSAHSMQLRGWREWELQGVLEVARFETREVFGGWDGRPWEKHASPETILVAR
jgi:SAM-dependent methyltransferase